MWVKSEAKSNGDGNRWLVGLFSINDNQRTIPSHSFTFQGIQGWTDLQIGCPNEGCYVGVLPDGWAWGWMSGDREFIEVHKDAQNVRIRCGSDGCPTAWPHQKGSIELTTSKDRD